MFDYTLSSDSRRWWWPSAAAGTFAAGAVAAVLATPLTGAAAIPEPIEPTGSATGVQATADLTGFTRQCFMLQPRWNTALDGAIPRCAAPVNVGDQNGAVRADPGRCPSLPDPRFVGGPWAAEVEGCPRVSRWWRYVTVE